MERNIRKNKKVLIVLLIVLLLLLAVGYAIFSDTLTIQGTANAKGTFDLEFQNAEVVKMQGVNELETKVEILEDRNVLTVNVVDLEYPGAGAEFSVDIVNVGTIPAKVQAIKQTNINESGSIKVRGLEVINTDHPTIGAGDRCNIHFVVEIPPEETEVGENENISFSLEIEYVQSTENFTGKIEHVEMRDGKIIPEYTVPTGITAKYGQTLAEVKLPKEFEFQDSLETLVGDLGTNTFKVKYVPTDTEKYNIITDIEVEIAVEKGIPKYTIPTGLIATYGQTLANVKLPEGFSFQDKLETSVGELGTRKFKVTYTPEDIENYNIITNIEVSILVQKTGKLTDIITGSDYGRSINYSTTVNGTTVSNWKVFLNDGKNVYIMLDNYLPNRLLPTSTGLQTSGTYEVYSNVNGNTLVNRLATASYWSEFAGGISGAIATGSPTMQQFVASWNENPAVNGRKIVANTIYWESYNGGPLTDKTKFYILNKSNGCGGYWFASSYVADSVNFIWNTYYNGVIHFSTYYYFTGNSVRPVVCLPSNLTGSVGDTVKI